MKKDRKVILQLVGFMICLVLFLIGLLLLVSYLFSLSSLGLHELWNLLTGYTSIHETDAADLFFIGLFTIIVAVFAFSIGNDIRKRNTK
jgi:hypothetical protein